MSAYTKGPWKLHRGFSDWNLPCQHDVFVGNDDEADDLIAGIPSVTPSALGASEKQRGYARTQWANAQLIVCAPEMVEMLHRIYCGGDPREYAPGTLEELLKKAGVL